MPLSQRDQYSDRKGMGLVRWGAAICLLAVLFGTVCMTIVATMGKGEDPPKIFEQMGAASCVIFCVGLIISIVGWVISLNNKPEPPKLTAASAGVLLDDDDSPEEDGEDEGGKSKPAPYDSEHRRREN